MNRVLIYGTHHPLQYRSNEATDELALTRLHYASDIANILASQIKIDIVLEEASSERQQDSIAALLAFIGLRSHLCVGPPPSMQLSGEGCPDMSLARNKEIAAAMEQSMFEKTLSECREEYVDGLMICGLYHVSGLRQRFQGVGAQVTVGGIVLKDWCSDALVGPCQSLAQLKRALYELDSNCWAALASYSHDE